ncbi:MAG: NAD(P)H-binding protein [Myxococcota bacterium]
MRIIVFGANGGLGQRVWKAAVDAGHEVVAFVRSPQKLDATDPRFGDLTVVAGNVLDSGAVQGAAAGARAAINCTSPASGDATLDLATSAVTSAAAAGVERFYMVGGIGALWAPGTHRQVLLQDWDDEPAMRAFGLNPGMPRERIRDMTKGHLASMAFMQSTGHPHAFACPGAMYDGPATSGRTVSLDELASPAAMRVSLGDVAQVMVDDLERGELLGHRVSVCSGPTEA